MQDIPNKKEIPTPGANAKNRLRDLLERDRKVIDDNFIKKLALNKINNGKKFGFFSLTESELKKLEESSDKLDLKNIIHLDE
ncbi:MAG TPA: hypothetical protein PKV16_03540 [Caldisericia bacterium]|nr:hypothetical protein [Caldisericia bacterium]HPF48385.1 hypothetical protein [Caldisericia bacterium]HPI83436.1 hypothetical protein [Caldisericia bacterium]HPQ92839.1 hypothetical protein [Caldisericia bacterium]HRV74064.1 hypothetical protein [Caldisericia bacterium]